MNGMQIIPARIKLVRQANQLSLQQLADKMTADGYDITRAALSQYETGKIRPSDTMLANLCKELGAPLEFFFRPEWSDFSLRLFHDGVDDTANLRTQELYAFIQIEIERYALLDDLLGIKNNWQFSAKSLRTKDIPRAPEELAAFIRKNWHIGVSPIPSVCNLLESQGIYLIAIPQTFGFRYLSGYETSRMQPFIFYTTEAFTDDLRTNLLKELARFFIPGNLAYTDEALSRFALALMAPEELLFADFGKKRKRISLDELTIAKQRYGTSRREVMRRLYHLGIVDEEYYNDFYQYINQHRFLWRDSNMSNVRIEFYESPMAYNRKHARAIAEGLIDEPEQKYF